jgi:hypothetical protein
VLLYALAIYGTIECRSDEVEPSLVDDIFANVSELCDQVVGGSGGGRHKASLLDATVRLRHASSLPEVSASIAMLPCAASGGVDERRTPVVERHGVGSCAGADLCLISPGTTVADATDFFDSLGLCNASLSQVVVPDMEIAPVLVLPHSKHTHFLGHSAESPQSFLLRNSFAVSLDPSWVCINDTHTRTARTHWLNSPIAIAVTALVALASVLGILKPS